MASTVMEVMSVWQTVIIHFSLHFMGHNLLLVPLTPASGTP